MAPARKSRSVNKRFTYEASPEKDASKSNRTNQRRKLSDKLGPQWTKGELQRFYDAFRKYRKNWKKVAAAVRNRSVEMVEALYSMNRAYLSLPEGTASVAGLIAMMTDHYNVMEGSDSECGSDDQKPQKHKRPKIPVGSSKDESSHFQSNESNDGCLFYLKGGLSSGNQPRAVGKRTPRVPVHRENFVMPNKKARTLEVDARVDEGAHVAALALTEALQRVGSPQVSSSPYGRTEHKKSPPVRSWGKMFVQAETAQGKHHCPSIYEGSLDGSPGGRKLENGAHARDRKSLLDMEGVGTVEVHRKGKKIYGKRMQVEDNHSDDDAEACSGTGGLKGSALKGFDTTAQSSPRAQKKRNKKLFCDDELDALQALAELSTMESESSVQFKEDQNADDKCSVPEATSIVHHREKAKHVSSKGKQVAESTTTRKSRICTPTDGLAISESKEPLATIGTLKRKRKSSISMVSNAEDHMDLHSIKQARSEASAEEENKSTVKNKRVGPFSAQPKQLKSPLRESSTHDDQKRAGMGLPISTTQVPAQNIVNLPAKQPNRRKRDLKRQLSMGMKASDNFTNNSLNKYPISLQDGILRLKERLSSCLSASTVRRWSMFEWFYCAIDYPWFAKREFVEYLNHVGLGHIPRLTRVEWGVIRSSLGKPRRFSEHFLHEERCKLHKYRETVRKTYTDLRTGAREGVPTDLACPLSVGQRVIAIHPKTREIHDGSILTVDHDKCRVQFDRPEIGVEFVMDIDCMPVNPLDNMPEALRRQNIALHKFSEIAKDAQASSHSNLGGPMIFANGGRSELASTPVNTKQDGKDHAISQSKTAVIDRISSQQACYGQPLSGAPLLAREADIRAISDVNRANIKRDALVMELRNANNAIAEDQYNGDGSLKDFEPFKNHYATVLVQLKEANDQASSAVLQLRQRNTYPGNSPRPWMKHPASASVSGGLPNSVDNSLVSQESASGAVEIIKGSRLKAHTMVDAAIQAMSSMKEGEDAFVRIGEALDSLDKWQFISTARSQEVANGVLSNQNQMPSSATESMRTSSEPGSGQSNDPVKNNAQLPSELIASCVATLLMIQTCTERQYPPGDVAQIIDSAVTSLHPHCPQNLPLFREIQMCMGRIKTQILALIPT